MGTTSAPSDRKRSAAFFHNSRMLSRVWMSISAPSPTYTRGTAMRFPARDVETPVVSGRADHDEGALTR
ncbi:unannotated protein [freshwater metagenome]|uniref:Unannotated protein n=1 Tax=freshwater metagenome TaxID=449393 RepID=A0A6J6E9M0_9ZZZZ